MRSAGDWDERWPAVTRLHPDVVVLLPAGRGRLLDRLAARAVAVQGSRVTAARGNLR